MTQRELSIQAHIRQPQLSLYMSGKSRWTFEALGKIAKPLGWGDEFGAMDAAEAERDKYKKPVVPATGNEAERK